MRPFLRAQPAPVRQTLQGVALRPGPEDPQLRVGQVAPGEGEGLDGELEAVHRRQGAVVHHHEPPGGVGHRHGGGRAGAEQALVDRVHDHRGLRARQPATRQELPDGLVDRDDVIGEVEAALLHALEQVLAALGVTLGEVEARLVIERDVAEEGLVVLGDAAERLDRAVDVAPLLLQVREALEREEVEAVFHREPIDELAKGKKLESILRS